MRKSIVLLAALLFMANYSNARSMESARTAVANMGVGWNLGNSLDSHSVDIDNMWIERWTSRKPSDYETAWGQALATRELIHMFKEAGFNAIRIPVTWYPHYGTLNNSGLDWDMSKWSGYTVNSAWMKRVKQVVDYVIDEGMYCILNVHHDTGVHSTAWIKASTANHSKYGDRYTRLWTAIAQEFRDYGDHLLFEGYNEMTDKHNSWCFASFGAPGNYNESDAADAYKAVNAYAQDFVDAVRATGGNNATRNLIVNTYSAASGAGSWNDHLQDPLKKMVMPQDDAQNHIIFQVHSYWDTNSYNTSMKTDIVKMFNNIETYLINRLDAPVIVGEWGSDSENFDYSDEAQRKKLTNFATYFMQKATGKKIACFYWMGLSDGDDRGKPAWTQPELRDAIIKGYMASVDEIRTDAQQDAVYNLNGVRIDAPGPGISIVNGRKVLNGTDMR